MNADLVILSLAVGAFTWAFRFGPTRLRLPGGKSDSAAGRFLAATGPAAIATLFTASILPMLADPAGDRLPLAAGILAVLAMWGWRRSVLAATFAGAAGYGLAVHFIG
ncbi:AzlD domain-containing protein [Albidovulum sp.]|jgi:hypothetical protein|uniref:AzlD domain-containing protein n=1 Tax=Albidovulum sp. TaxID=1872424 RepID=UPI0039B8BFE2